jgi:hypothetical protein
MQEKADFLAPTVQRALWGFGVGGNVGDIRAFPGKVDTGFPKGNATNLESRALPLHGGVMRRPD